MSLERNLTLRPAPRMDALHTVRKHTVCDGQIVYHLKTQAIAMDVAGVEIVEMHSFAVLKKEGGGIVAV